MQFELYTDKTVAQCMKELTGRMEAKPTATRPALDGWIEKGGKFSIAVSSKVGRFQRTTRLRATVERESGVTIIRGHVPGGADKQGQFMALGFLLLVGALLLFNGEAMLAVFAALIGVGMFILLIGDNQNSETLMNELRRTLGAKTKPPKNLTRR